MDGIIAKLIPYEETGITIPELKEIVKNSELEKKQEVLKLLDDGTSQIPNTTKLQLEEANTMVTMLWNHAEDLSLISFNKSTFSDFDLHNITKPEALEDSREHSFDRRISSSFNQDQSKRFNETKSFWSSAVPNLDSPKEEDWFGTDEPDMSPQNSFSFATSSPLKKEFKSTPSKLSRMKSVLSPIKNPQSPSKSVNLIELDSPHVSKPPRFSTPTNMQLSFGSETTPTETKLAGMIGIPTESPTKLSKQLEKTELMLTEAEGLCARLENENKELVNEKMGLKKEFKDLKSKNERLEGMVQDYESQLSQLRVSSTDTVTSRIKEMQQKLSELTREREVDAQKHLESISNFEKKLEAMMDEKEKNNVYIGDLESRLETIMNEKSEKVEELLQFKGQVSDMKLENDKKDHQLNELLLQNELVMQEFQETKKELQEERQLKVEFKELYEKSLLTNTELRNRLYVSEHAVVGVVSVATQAHVETGNFQNQTVVDSKDVPCQTLENIELSTFSSGYTIDPIVKVDAGLQTTEPLTITRELQTSIKTRESSSQYDIVTKEVDTQADVDYTDLRCLDVSMVQNEEMERLYDSVQEWSRSIQLFEKDNVSLKQKISECQRFTMDMRQDLNLRGHYDKEVERWIDELRKQVKDLFKDVREKKDVVDVELKRSRELKEMVKLLKKKAIEGGVKTALELVDVHCQTDFKLTHHHQVQTDQLKTTEVNALVASTVKFLFFALLMVSGSVLHFFYTTNARDVIHLLVQKPNESMVLI